MANRKPREATTRATTQRRKPWAPPSSWKHPKHLLVISIVGSELTFVVMTTSPTYTRSSVRGGNRYVQTSIPTWEIATQ